MEGYDQHRIESFVEFHIALNFELGSCRCDPVETSDRLVCMVITWRMCFHRVQVSLASIEL